MTCVIVYTYPSVHIVDYSDLSQLLQWLQQTSSLVFFCVSELPTRQRIT